MRISTKISYVAIENKKSVVVVDVLVGGWGARGWGIKPPMSVKLQNVGHEIGHFTCIGKHH